MRSIRVSFTNHKYWKIFPTYFFVLHLGCDKNGTCRNSDPGRIAQTGASTNAKPSRSIQEEEIHETFASSISSLQYFRSEGSSNSWSDNGSLPWWDWWLTVMAETKWEIYFLWFVNEKSFERRKFIKLRDLLKDISRKTCRFRDEKFLDLCIVIWGEDEADCEGCRVMRCWLTCNLCRFQSQFYRTQSAKNENFKSKRRFSTTSEA